MRRVLVPTDFSDNALNAINYALEFFKYEICVFYFMHAYQDDIYTNEALLTRKTLEKATNLVSKKSKKQLEDVLKIVKEKHPNPRFTYRTISSNNVLVDEADKIVDNENIDIIVMGTQGKTDNRKLTFGSHTLQVLKYVECPVLAIPRNYKYTQPKHVLFPTNYLIPYKRRELKLLCEMLAPFRARVDMLYVAKSDKLSMRQEDNKAFIEETLCKNDTHFYTVNKKHVSEAINDYIAEYKIDMLVMVNTRHSHLENILYQSSIDKISLNVGIPFLALQNIKRDNF
ncbi:nucleotide-binding universal stress UspA family protein [Jejuia pallidilutea]|jgi:nucleotide-binding universal stress UspA family protein|uniref:Nucleotide-binding universal stress UspA family protein n=1 Tax=Jejuia pallidilutea TaxID=504487 RepID=A0A362XCG5_9FLAO|nr:universal stress protein [Jejuia pallidilutea]PQV50448.1 nucleotide-binding universal stress UspA family protein [Jejuia pallidilutea]